MTLGETERKNKKTKQGIMQLEGLDHFLKRFIIPMTVDERIQGLDTSRVWRALRIISTKLNVI